MWGHRALHAFSEASRGCSRCLRKPQIFNCMHPHASSPCSRIPCMQTATAAVDPHSTAAATAAARAAAATAAPTAAAAAAAAAAACQGPADRQTWRERSIQLHLQQRSLGLRENAILIESSQVLKMQKSHFSSGLRNTKSGIKNPYWRRRGFWEWRRRMITELKRKMRRRKQIFPREGCIYLRPRHPLNSSNSSSSNSSSSNSTNSSSSSSIGIRSSNGVYPPPPPFFVEENDGGEGGEVGGVYRGREGRKREKRKKRKGGGFDHDEDGNNCYFDKMEYLEKPIRGEGRVFVVKKEIIPIGRKRLLLLLRLIKGLQLMDATDWLESLQQYRCNYLLNVLNKKKEEIKNHGADPSRVYVEHYRIGPAGHVKTMRVGYHYRVSFLKSYRYSISLRLRELPLHELYHRFFILKKTPRSLTHDMRIALRQEQVPKEIIRDWLPYLDAPSRYQHKQRLRFLDKQRLFNYMLSRRAFVYSYISRMRKMHEEAAASRGLTLHALQASFQQSPKIQLKGIDYPQD